MDLSTGTLIGQMVALAVIVALAIVVIRFLLAATRRMNREAGALERETGESGEASSGRS